MDRYTPSTVPGCRLPHVWLSDGRSLYDALGPFYTLVRTDPEIDVSALLSAANRSGVPLCLLDVGRVSGSPLDRGLILARPDQHVAWRSDAAPLDADSLIARLRGDPVGNIQ